MAAGMAAIFLLFLEGGGNLDAINVAYCVLA